MTNIPLDCLRCPASGTPLVARDGELVSADQIHVYPVVDGVPILIDDASSVFRKGDVARSGRRAAGRRSRLDRVVDLLPSDSLNPRARQRFARFADLVRQSPGRARVLVVGGGQLGQGMTDLAADDEVDLIETDIYLGERVAVACDAHRLPFVDATFDGVIVQAVLEHVLSPETVVGEIHRVLRPGGIVYAETPFMQQVHEGAFDFTRFTELGHRRLFRRFEEIDRGAALGPATALLWSLRHLARSLPARPSVLVDVLGRLVIMLFFWVQYLDYWLLDHPGARDAASGTYFLGRRVDGAISDQEIVASYEGAVRSAVERRSLRVRAANGRP